MIQSLKYVKATLASNFFLASFCNKINITEILINNILSVQCMHVVRSTMKYPQRIYIVNLSHFQNIFIKCLEKNNFFLFN